MWFIWQWWWAVVPIVISIISVAMQQNDQSIMIVLIWGAISVVSGLSAAILIHRAVFGENKSRRRVALVLGSLACSINVINALEVVARTGQNRGDHDRVLIDLREQLSTRNVHLQGLATKLEKVSQNDPVGTIEAHIRKLQLDELYGRSRKCEDVTLPDSRAFCREFHNVKSRLSAARELEKVRVEIQGIWQKLTSMESAPQSSEPGLDAMSELIGIERERLRSYRDNWIAFAVELICWLMPTLLQRPATIVPTVTPEVLTRVGPTEGGPHDLVRRWASERLRHANGEWIRGGTLQEDFQLWCRTRELDLPKSWRSVLSQGLISMGYAKVTGQYTKYMNVKFAPQRLEVI